jgi:PAS domain S-box-containing protein
MDSVLQLSCLRDARVAPFATSALPCWLWGTDGTRLLWVNAVGAALLGGGGSADARHLAPSRRFVTEMARLAATLSPGASPRLERLRGLTSALAPPLTCACSRIVIGTRTSAVLVAAIEPAGPDLPLVERARRLLDGIDAPLAVLAPDGHLLHATESARRNCAAPEAMLRTPALLAHAFETGHATARVGEDEIAIDRLGAGTAAVLLVRFLTSPTAGSRADTPAVRANPPPQDGAKPAREPSTSRRASPPTSRCHPLRFIWQMDEDGRFTIESDELIRLLGTRTADLLGHPWQEIIAELHVDPDHRVARAVATRETWSGIALAWPVDDEPDDRLPIELSGLPVLDRDRIFRGYRGFGVCRDLARLDALARRVRATTIRPAAVDGKTIEADRTSPDTPLPVAASSPLAPTTDRPVPELSTLELRAFRELSRKLNQRLTAPPPPAHDTVSPAPLTPPEHVLAATSPDADATARPRSEIRELQAILDIATDGVIVLDRHGVILSVNKSAQALFGYDADELTGSPLAKLFAPGSAEEVELYLASLAGGDAAPLLNAGAEVDGRVRQGGVVRLFLSLGRIGEDTDRLCAVLRDITPWKQTEDGLTAATRRAEQASAAKSDLLANISHEIRTPLNSIIGFAQVMMEERLGPIGNARYREYVGDILASGEHLLSVINDLLDLSKIEAGKLDLAFASVSLNDVTQQCVTIMQSQASRERVIVRTSLAPALPPVIADARSLRQILLNLLSNAVKFTAAGGQVIVSTARDDAGHAVVRVRDTGAGMSERELAVALEPFGQLPGAAETTTKGTGLGLPLSKALAEANRARFRIKSTPGDGTLVEIAFPASQLLG